MKFRPTLLGMVAAKRSRKLANGAEPTVDVENDKMTVVALREIAAGHIGPEILEEVEQRPAPGLFEALLARASFSGAVHPSRPDLELTWNCSRPPGSRPCWRSS